jgi:hypothetical protein
VASPNNFLTSVATLLTILKNQMVVMGAGGHSARLTVIEGVPVSSGYYVEADLDSLPGYEWRSIDHPWI